MMFLIEETYCQGNNVKTPWEMMIYFRTRIARGIAYKPPWKLDVLLKKELISKDEYEKKRKEILDAL